jgi:hypothetical protein
MSKSEYLRLADEAAKAGKHLLACIFRQWAEEAK